MRKKYFIMVILALIVALVALPACTASKDDTIKAITKPYIDEYECVEAKFGEADLLQNFDYIIISLIDDENLELTYKTKKGEKHKIEGTYTVDSKTREFIGEIGLLGYKLKEKTKIEKGQFILTLNIFNRPLYMKFRSK